MYMPEIRKNYKFLIREKNILVKFKPMKLKPYYKTVLRIYLLDFFYIFFF